MQAPHSIELARDFAQVDARELDEQFILVALAGVSFALPVTTIQEVSEVPPIVPVPHSTGWVSGIVNLRGSVLTVIDLARLAEIGRWTVSPMARMLVTRDADPVGVLVDDVSGLRRFPAGRSPIGADALSGQVADFVTAVLRSGNQSFFVLDLAAALEVAEQQLSSSSPRFSTVGVLTLPANDSRYVPERSL